MKVYHMGSKYSEGSDMQLIFVASDDSEGVNKMKEIYAQITAFKKQKTVEILVPKDWNIRTHYKEE